MRPGSRETGFASLLAIGAVFLVSGLLLAWTGPFLFRATRERAKVGEWNRRAGLEGRAIEILTDLERETDGDTRLMLAYSLPPNASLRDTQSRLAINWVRKFVFLDSPLIGLFKKGTPDDLQAYRAKVFLSTSSAGYEAFFDPADIARYFSLDAPINVNTVDEFAFERAMAEALGSESDALSWRERLRALRSAGTVLEEESDVRSWFGATWDSVSAFVTANPEWNANTLDPLLLVGVLSCPEFGLASGASAAGAILEARSGRYLEKADLRRLLGLPEEAALWAHLGTESDCWTLRVADEEGLVLDLCFLRRRESEGGAVFKIVSRQYEQS